MHNIIAVAADAFTAGMSGAPTDVIRGGHEGIGGADVGTIIKPATSPSTTSGESMLLGRLSSLSLNAS